MTLFRILTPIILTGAALFDVAGGPAAAVERDAATRCDVSREVSARLDAAALGGVLMEVGAGALEVVGVEGNEIRVAGTICASDDALARDARLILEERRGAAWVESDLPEVDGGWRDDYVRMDLRVEMPARLAADIRDGSGEVVVGRIAAVRIEDGSGSIRIEDVPGEVAIEDGSGEVELRRVGPVRLDDGSGGIDVVGVTGDMLITEDGSGSIDLEDITGTVRIDEDGSGSIRVRTVSGDLIVGGDASGGIDYRDVRGTVRLPERR